eukprot:TRINITY_DN41165_c0_g1_i1.p1 TRINITY_DN41165_c0_g1~~TRINITY_DN41165_c0_g1_i1.p1  ORF type:complete len:162 (-),score=29.06 TRINITY_DN41165_c0_g1_i1:147-632(-)
MAGSTSIPGQEEAPLLTAEEEMQYQRALWVNRLLKEQLAIQTQGLSIKEIEEAQAQIQASMREALQAASVDGAASRRLPSTMRPPSRSLMAAGSQSAAQTCPPARVAHSAVNRRRRDDRIRQENSAFLKRLESVKSSLTPRAPAANAIPRLPPRSRLLSQQ